MNSQTATITATITQPSKELTETELDQLVALGEEIRKQNETNKFKVSLQVIGIKKRCRKSERHFFQLGHVNYNNGKYSKEIISDQVRDFLATNMKAIHSLTRVSLDHVIIKNENGFTVTQWEPFSDKNVKFDLNIVL